MKKLALIFCLIASACFAQSGTTDLKVTANGDVITPQGANFATGKLKVNGVAISPGGSGTVTSVAVTAGHGLGVSGSPITTTGTIILSLDANLTAIAGLTTTTFGRDFLTLADIAAAKTKLAYVFSDLGSRPTTIAGYGITDFNSLGDARWVPLTRTILTTSPLAGGGDLSANRTLTIADAAADGSTKGAATFTAVDFNATSGNISIDYTNAQAATGSVKGFLTAADWTAFNAKELALTFSTGLTRSTNTITVNTSQNIATLSNLTGNGFVKTSGGTGALSIDTSTYLTTDTKWDGGATGLTASTGRTSLGATTVGGNIFTLTNPGAITFLKVAADNTVSTESASTFRTSIGAAIGTNVQAYDADLDTWATITPGTGIGTFLATPTSANLISAVTNETGTGSLVFATSPTLVTPLLGTPTSGTLTNCTGLPQAGTVGLTTADSPQFTAVNIGNASDTTVARVGAGQISVEGVNVVTTSSTDTLTNKTLDASGTGNVVKLKSYIYLSHPHLVDGTNATLGTTSTAIDYGHATFSHSVDQATNYAEYYFQVPEDIDTSVALRARIKIRLGGADTGSQRYVLSSVSVADSAVPTSSTLANAINVDFAGDGSGASGDVETSAWTTLTSWAGALTAGQTWRIRFARDGDTSDASTVNSTELGLVIEYGVTQ